MKNLLLITGVLLLLAIDFPSKGAILTASVSAVDITPLIEMKYTLGGYGERMNKPAEAIHDRIWAKALALRKGNRKYAIITLDILGLPSNVKSDLIKRISDEGWNMENIMLLPSHSHGSLEMAALNSKNVLNSPQIGIFQPELLEFLLDKLEALVKEVDRNYQPVKIGTESRLIDGLNRNRRKDPDVDKELIVTRIDLTDGKPLAVLVNWTAHPTFLGGKDMLVSGEWPGYLQSELQDLIGNGVTVMFYNGAEGDQSPILNEAIDGYKKIEIYGKKIAVKAFDLFNEIKPRKVKDFKYSYNTITLPEHTAHPAFMKTGGDEYGLNENTVKIVIKMLGPTEVGLGAVRIGDLLISGVPGEMTAELGMKVKRSLKIGGIKYVAIGGLANEWISYILSRDQYINGEGYESSVSFYGPDLGEIISNEIIKSGFLLTKAK
ncbi:MAG: neutral/alkaline non-lysosomal ceramidase N-terminal domain-containing protein [Bacteroidales bacterium]|nr:neutral/alkaline non-lysosomal ceramidase N-terminal domain-containing protein [Bacteroidales bacterium]